MKVAIVIGGQPRGGELSCQFLLEGLVHCNPAHEIDLFVHTWFDNALANQTFSSAQPHQSGKIGCYHPDIPNIFISRLRPRSFLIERPRDFEQFSHLEDLPTVTQKHLASMYYSTWRANNLKSDFEAEYNFQYDLVIKTRVDLRYFEPIIFENIIDQDLSNAVYVAAIHQHMRMNDAYPRQSGGNYSSMSDTLVAGTSKNIDKICDIYPDFESIHHDIKPFQYGECYIGYQRTKHNLQVKMAPMNYQIYRG